MCLRIRCHSYAPLLVENHTPLPSVQQYMGHSDIKSTIIYLQLVSIPAQKEVSPVDLVFNLQ
ncbi:tyrosine-type recombinase/integrase [Arachidicoccus ginsenosidivorans]|uniref:Tyrosine-type recombinase/integrase n=1 Tax=Arachidicoccus ginsenosidivorans TaxID=496057 RepID=A0A5B8VP44_9BACT|nr:tyrosine-type recombinase/integrase [Arachidicoccus ginsenosidivorans]